MEKIFKRKSVSAQPRVEPNIAALIDKMQQQLTFLEKKIDTLISQSAERPSFDRGSQDNNYRQRNFTKVICAGCKAECEVPFKPSGDRPVYCKECFAKRKESGPRGRDFAKGRNFDKSQGRENYGFGGRRKPSFRRRKERD